MSHYANFGYVLLDAQVDRAPDQVALTYLGKDHISYAELDRRVNRRAHALTAAGVRSGERIATLLDSTLTVAEIYLAQAKLGTVLAALNPFWDPAVFAAVVDRAQARVFLYDGRFDELVTSLRDQLPHVRLWIRVGGPAAGAVDLDALTSVASPDAPDILTGGDDPLAMYFTSGTTGLPKAVLHTHASALAVAEKLWLDVPLGHDAVIGTGPIIWGIGFIAVAAPALAGGARLVLEESYGPAHFLEAVPREKITHISVTPSFFVELLGNPGHERVDLGSLRVALLGGEPLLPSLQRRILDRLPQLSLFGYYGQTEAPYSVLARRDLVPDGVTGWPRVGGAVRVVGPDGQRVTDTVGEIQLAGPHVMAGYDGQPEATAQSLKDGWFAGGDLGSMDSQGRLSVLGRRADAIAKDGSFTLPLMVEDAASAINGVTESAAVGVPADAEEQQILLVVTARPGAPLDPESLRIKLSETLPPASRPDLVVVADELPHANDGSGGQGKLLRREVRERWGHLLVRP